MGEQRSYFEEAAEALERAMKATGLGEQGVLLEEALRLNRLALAEERIKLAQMRARGRGASDQQD